MGEKKNACGCSSCGEVFPSEQNKQEIYNKEEGQPSLWQRIKTLLFEEKLLALLSGILLLLGWLSSYWGVSSEGQKVFFLAAALIGGMKIYRKAAVSLFKVNLDMNVLVTISVVGAIFIDKWAEAAMVVFLFAAGAALESYTMEKNRRSIGSLIDLAPREGRVFRNGEEIKVLVEEIHTGDTALIKPGEMITVDGFVVKGFSSVNQAAITGESHWVEKQTGDEVFSGTMNQHGYLEVMVTREAQDTTLAKIIHLVEEAQSKKAVSQQVMDRFAGVYTPLVISLAVVIAVILPLAFRLDFITWFYRGLTLLVISCPCALVISTPVSIVSAIGNAAKRGILIKGGAHLEEAGRISVAAFDKTGTLTEGKPVLNKIISCKGFTREQILSLAASLESRSEHPLGKAITREAKKLKLNLKEPEKFEALTAMGVKGKLDGELFFVGRPLLFEKNGVNLAEWSEDIKQLEEEGQTVLVLGTCREILGLLSLADQIRGEAYRAVEKLKNMGIKTVMLTGDNPASARNIAEKLGIDQYHAALLPQDKVEKMKELTGKYGKTIMVGDGINDAPALAVASVGIAMGAAGSDTALETADIALMSDDLSGVPEVIQLSRAAVSIIKQNIAFSLLIKLGAVLLVFPGWLTLWMAVLADEGVLLLVSLNGMRLMGFGKKNKNGKISKTAQVTCTR
ncbi:heavy metal translocating P-type ATPase [Candidatus Contubernalis alkaliaceticus]|uniref:heavy metal translocating P-type ATPase n=1 Tax=Candidatus Contubernalis alkaliaceticus TaxID=338645 RepID=UPI001F4BF9F0|nr:heavy metal translocating P-type ATPase [Candidatus Contubernalis alkalaceticus]UNC91483.1 heavy metal translocating P-type ATPase [Candidatus Contubernalis alkalaceticus]